MEVILEVGLAGCVCSEEDHSHRKKESRRKSHSSLGIRVLVGVAVVVWVLVDMDNTGVEWDPQVVPLLFSEIETL